MRLVEYNVLRRETRNASGKAKCDASDILESLGFERMYQPSNWRLMRIVEQLVHIMTLQRGSVVVIQYPGNKPFFYRLLRKREGIKTIAIIHDVDSLRNNGRLDAEVDLLSGFDCLIVHNASMCKVLRSHGCSAPMVELGLFDYLLKEMALEGKGSRNSVAFAGNFEKAPFVQKLNQIGGLNFNLYGVPEFLAPTDDRGISYLGSFSSEEIVGHISGSWGLVWDGDSLDTCSGMFGEYLRFNCPHKASMYLAAGRPLIVWKQAAIASFVENENIGIAVSDLNEAAEIVASISEERYAFFLENVSRVRNDLIAGNHLRQAMFAALGIVAGKNEQL